MEEDRPEQIFRKKSMDRISSPEKLDEYLKVNTPGIWLIMAAVITLLAGIFIWSCTGRLETTVRVSAAAEKETVKLALTEEDAERAEEGMKVYIGGKETRIEYIQYEDPDRAVAVCTADVPDGNYQAEIVIESIRPIRFLFR